MESGFYCDVGIVVCNVHGDLGVKSREKRGGGNGGVGGRRRKGNKISVQITSTDVGRVLGSFTKLSNVHFD